MSGTRNSTSNNSGFSKLLIMGSIGVVIFFARPLFKAMSKGSFRSTSIRNVQKADELPTRIDDVWRMKETPGGSRSFDKLDELNEPRGGTSINPSLGARAAGHLARPNSKESQENASKDGADTEQAGLNEEDTAPTSPSRR